MWNRWWAIRRSRRQKLAQHTSHFRGFPYSVRGIKRHERVFQCLVREAMMTTTQRCGRTGQHKAGDPLPWDHGHACAWPAYLVGRKPCHTQCTGLGFSPSAKPECGSGDGLGVRTSEGTRVHTSSESRQVSTRVGWRLRRPCRTTTRHLFSYTPKDWTTHPPGGTLNFSL